MLPAGSDLMAYPVERMALTFRRVHWGRTWAEITPIAQRWADRWGRRHAAAVGDVEAYRRTPVPGVGIVPFTAVEYFVPVVADLSLEQRAALAGYSSLWTRLDRIFF